MRIIKYFFEEPTQLDLPTEAEGARPVMRKNRHFRGYLAASDLTNDMVGGSSLEDNAAAEVLSRVIGGPIWFSNRVAGQDDVSITLLSNRKDIVQALSTMGSDSVMLMDVDPTEKLVKALTDDSDRQGMRLIAELLDGGCTLVFPEKADMGHDWSIFSSRPLAERMREAMAGLPEDTRGFVIPYVEARGGDKFYFEQYDLGLFAQHEVL